MWELNGIPAIYNLDGTATSTPIVRITIGPDGSVSMMGRRSLVSALEPLELFNGALFNVINWKKTEPNAVMATMVVTGTTVMNGLGVGRKVVPCP